MKDKCKRPEALEYLNFERRVKRHLNTRYKCNETGRRCNLNKCEKYKTCTKSAKKNYEAWKDAYNNDKRIELERLSRGGM